MRVKNINTKKVRSTKNNKVGVASSEEGASIITKNKMPINSESEKFLDTDERTGDEATISDIESDEVNSDEISLDDDELNPFGDKWEQ